MARSNSQMWLMYENSSLASLKNKSLVENEETCSGIVLLFTNQNISVVCDEHWNVESPLAHVVCLESGCGSPNATWTLQAFPYPSTEAIQGVQCTGKESSVSECNNSVQAVTTCAPDKIAAVTCNQNVTNTT
ncbi:hypothetical protein GDO86_019651, partial [Hymenochirus boettgeri]